MKQTQVEWARRLIDDQLERLSELRNANPRDPGFKLWRQTTLTIIQRIWPGDLARCERFRRVPFSSTSPRATRTQIRENFERGCAEASAYLRILTLELETQGVTKTAPGAPAPKPATLPEEQIGSPTDPPYDPRDMYEPSPLDRIKSGPAPASPPASAPMAPASPPSPKPSPPPEPVRASEPPPPPPVEPPSAPPKPPPRPAAPPVAHRAEALQPPPERRLGRQQLKEMLGFVDEAAQRAASPPAPSSPAPATPPPPPREVVPAIPAVEPAGYEAPVEEPPSFAPEPPPPAFAAEDDLEEIDPRLEEMMAEAEERAFHPEVTPPGRELSAGPGDLTIEFLNRPPRSAAPPAPASAAPPASRPTAPPPAQPVTPPPAAPETPPAPPVVPARTASVAPVPAAPPPPSVARQEPAHVEASLPPSELSASEPEEVVGNSPTAAALVAIAAQVGRLGVPDSQRAAARAALIDLAKQLDEEIASFDSIREILWIVADYPALARRTIPLLIPYLDLE